MSENHKIKCKIIYRGIKISLIIFGFNLLEFFQWIACGVGVISCSAAVFSLIAVWKGNEKFKQEIMLPIKEFVSKNY